MLVGIRCPEERCALWTVREITDGHRSLTLIAGRPFLCWPTFTPAEPPGRPVDLGYFYPVWVGEDYALQPLTKCPLTVFSDQFKVSVEALVAVNAPDDHTT